MIEVLSAWVLTNEFPGVDPKEVRIFEHYDPSNNPLTEWQEVKFGSFGFVDNKSTFQKIVAILIPDKNPPQSYVDDPVWVPMSQTEIAQAAAIQ